MTLDDATERALWTALAPTSAFHEASRAVTMSRLDREDLDVIARIVLRMTFASLVQLLRETDDWCAWVPLLVVVMRGRQHEDTAVLRAAEAHLRGLARRVLDAQGFRRVRVEDVLGQPPKLQRALQALLFAPDVQ